MQSKNIGVVGAGAWGTALAQTMALAGHDVVLWAFEEQTVADITERHVNAAFLPGIALEEEIKATTSLSDVAQCDTILLVPPAQHLRKIASELAPHVGNGMPVVVCAKGIEVSSGELMLNVAAQSIPQAVPAILSGPSFASDVARGLPTALTLACRNEIIGRNLAETLGYRQLRLYWSQDTVGVQFGGAFKNVLAIAAGVVDGKALGASAHAALVARGFQEMRRLGVAMGADATTLTGLSGLGDLILTCGSAQSRNMSLGRALGQGQAIDDILGGRTAVTEGVHTAKAVHTLAQKLKVSMPISESVFGIVTGATNVDQAIADLLSRPLKSEAQ